MRDFKRKFGWLLLVCLLAAPCAVAAQDDAARKRAAFKKLVAVTRMAAYSSRLFDELVTRYQEKWADSVITDFRARGLLKPYSPRDAARVEQLIREMGDHTFDEIKLRAAREIYTDELMEAIAGPPTEKLLTADELESLAAFLDTPAGRKLTGTASKLLADSVAASLEERGFFNLLPSPEEESARIDRLAAEMRARPPVGPEQLEAAWMALPPDHFSEEERLQVLAFASTPAAAKLAGGFTELLRELAANVAPHAPRMGQLTAEVFNKHTQEFARRAGELEIAPAQGPRARGRRRRR